MKMFSVAQSDCLASLNTQVYAQDHALLRALQTIPMRTSKDVSTTWMWMSKERLFVAGLENGSVELVDLQAWKC